MPEQREGDDWRRALELAQAEGSGMAVLADLLERIAADYNQLLDERAADED
jgi:hypothetical protein